MRCCVSMGRRARNACLSAWRVCKSRERDGRVRREGWLAGSAPPHRYNVYDGEQRHELEVEHELELGGLEVRHGPRGGAVRARVESQMGVQVRVVCAGRAWGESGV